MKRTLCLLFALALVCTTTLCSCMGARINYLEESFFSMDTFMYFKVKDASSEIMRDAKNVVYVLEKTFSKTYSESTIFKLNNSTPTDLITLNPDAKSLFNTAFSVHEITGGAYNPFVGALAEAWESAGTSGVLPENDIIKLYAEHATSSSVVFEDSHISRTNLFAKLDFGGIAKGYAAGKAVSLLRENGISDAMLNLGGNIAVMGESESNKGKGFWTVGIKNPFKTDELVGTANVTDCFISVSGAYERFYEIDGKKYHHILDAQTGFPSDSGLASVAVICSEKSSYDNPAAVADALSTALFVMGLDKAKDFYNSGELDFEVVLITDNGNVYFSDGLDFNCFSESVGINGCEKLSE